MKWIYLIDKGMIVNFDNYDCVKVNVTEKGFYQIVAVKDYGPDLELDIAPSEKDANKFIKALRKLIHEKG